MRTLLYVPMTSLLFAFNSTPTAATPAPADLVWCCTIGKV